MDTNMTFRMDSEVKEQMSAICKELGMTPSAAFNLFANAFVQAKGMPFSVTVDPEEKMISREAMLQDTAQLLAEFSEDYKRMAE